MTTAKLKTFRSNILFLTVPHQEVSIVLKKKKLKDFQETRNEQLQRKGADRGIWDIRIFNAEFSLGTFGRNPLS
jgi:hypothetical protein